MNEIKAKIEPSDLGKLSGHQIRNVEVDKESISFYTNEKNIRMLAQSIDNISYHNVLRYKLKSILSKYAISIICVFIIIGLLINQSNTVQEIRFINYDTYDEVVEDYLKTKLKKVGPFYYLNEPIRDINLELKRKFYQYDWISIEKKGAILEVIIHKQKDKDQHQVDDGKVGDFVATKDAIIKMYYVKKGVVLIKEMQSVSKGDLLVTGNLKHHIGGVEYIKPDGIVVGETLKYETISVPKVQTSKVKTGKLEVKTNIVLFGSKIKINSNFKEYEMETNERFKLGSIFAIKKTMVYEVQQVNTIYSYEEALQYARSLIERDFSPSKYERIISIDLVHKDDTEDAFYFRFVVKKHENIAEFLQVDQN